MPLSTNVAVDDPGHAGLHNAERTVINANEVAAAAAGTRVLVKRNIAADYTLVAADDTDRILHVTAGAVVITLPADAVAIAQEVAIPWRQYAAGAVTSFVAAAGVTLDSRGAAFRSAGRYAEGTVTKVGANAWVLSGDIQV